MNQHVRTALATLVAALLWAGPSPAARAADAAAPSVIANGDFELDADSDMKPDAWSLPAGATWEAEGANHFLRLKVQTAGEGVLLYKRVDLKPDQKAFELTYRSRHEDVKAGAEPHFDGRIMMNFKDANGAVVKPSPKAPNFRGTSKEWTDRKQLFAVPEGAAYLEMMFTLFKAERGTLDFDDVKLVTIPADQLPPPPAPKPPKTAARKVPPPAPDKMPPMLHVVGNQLQDPTGRQVWLQGLAIPSLEWSATGDNVLGSVEIGLDTWKANVVRLPVKDDFWYGRTQYQKDEGKAYRELIDSVINTCASRGAYCVFDLHRFGAPKEEHVAFWKEIAVLYKDNPAVLFELFNEAHGIPWAVWRDGGPAKEKKKVKGEDGKTTETVVEFQSPGMQKLVNAVRETGAKNVVIAGGLDWGYDLSGVVLGFALTDAPGANGIMYSSHVYPWKSDWHGKFLTCAERHPIFLGEVGADVRKMPFLPKGSEEDPATWVPDMLGTIQKHKLNWTGWCFHPASTPRMILDWDYAPTPFWGEPAKQAMAGKQFEVKKQR